MLLQIMYNYLLHHNKRKKSKVFWDIFMLFDSSVVSVLKKHVPAANPLNYITSMPQHVIFFKTHSSRNEGYVSHGQYNAVTHLSANVMTAQLLSESCAGICWNMKTSSNGNIFRVTGHLCGEFTDPRWIPRTKASDAELKYSLSSASE